MKVSRKSIHSGKVTERELDVTQDQLDRYERGEGLIQEIFPHLSASDREFLMTGLTDEEWDEVMGEEDEE
jgi:hypothetical protein